MSVKPHSLNLQSQARPAKTHGHVRQLAHSAVADVVRTDADADVRLWACPPVRPRQHPQLGKIDPSIGGIGRASRGNVATPA
jgi:hypothetical protein